MRNYFTLALLLLITTSVFAQEAGLTNPTIGIVINNDNHHLNMASLSTLNVDGWLNTGSVASIKVYLNGRLAGTVPNLDGGSWSYQVDPLPGLNEIYLTVRCNYIGCSIAGDQTPTRTFTYVKPLDNGDFLLTPDPETGQVTIDWIKHTGSGTENFHYQVFRSTIDDPNTALAINNWTMDNSFVDTDIQIGTTYYYWIRVAVNRTGQSYSVFATSTSTTVSGLVSISSEMGSFSSQLDSQTISLNSNTDWVATSTEPWISVTPTTGTVGTSVLKIICNTNTSGLQRNGNVVITAGGNSVTYTVTQDANLSVPDNFAMVSNSTSSISLSWESVPNATSYDIFDCQNNFIVNTSDTRYTFDNLLPGTSMECKIRSVNGQEVSEFTLCQLATTGNIQLYMDSICGLASSIVALPVTVELFNNVTSLQGVFSSPSNNEVKIVKLDGGLSSDARFFSNLDTTTGQLTFLWSSVNAMGISLTDGDTLFNIFVELVGNEGDEGSIQMISTSSTPIEFSQSGVPVNVSINDGKICIYQTSAISGRVLDRDDNPIDSILVELTGGSNAIEMTGSDGSYVFGSIPYGRDLIVSPYKNRPIRDGVDIADVVRTRWHILGIIPFSNPFEYIAANVVNSGFPITALDIFYMEQFILGNESSFPIGRSYVFIPNDFVFSDLNNPFPYDTSRVYIDLQNDATNQDYVAVKIGDVTGDASFNYRLGSNIYIGIQDQIVSSDEVLVPVKGISPDSVPITGMQWSQEYDANVLRYKGIDYINTDILKNCTEANNFGTEDIDNGILTFIWSTPNAQALSIPDTTTLYVIRFQVVGEECDSSYINTNSAATPSIAYDENLNPIDVTDMGGIVKTKMIVDNDNLDHIPFALVCHPNPLLEEAIFTFNLSEQSLVHLNVLNTGGRIVRQFSKDLFAGTQKISWDGKDFLGRRVPSGLYLVQLSTSSAVGSIKVFVSDN